MAIFSKVKKILEKEEACVISKNASSEYVVMRWSKYQQLSEAAKELEELKRVIHEEGEDEKGYDIDINKIPV